MPCRKTLAFFKMYLTIMFQIPSCNVILGQTLLSNTWDVSVLSSARRVLIMSNSQRIMHSSPVLIWTGDLLTRQYALVCLIWDFHTTIQFSYICPLWKWNCRRLAWTSGLLIAAWFVAQGNRPDSLATALLAQGIMKTALEWFNTEPGYYGKFSPAENRYACWDSAFTWLSSLAKNPYIWMSLISQSNVEHLTCMEILDEVSVPKGSRHLEKAWRKILEEWKDPCL